MKKITLLILMLFVSIASYSQFTEDFVNSAVYSEQNPLPNGIAPETKWHSSYLGGGSRAWRQIPPPAAGAITPGYATIGGVTVPAGQGPYTHWLISPAIDLSTVLNPRLKFSAKSSVPNNQGDVLKVMITDGDPNDFGSYVELANFQEFYTGLTPPVNPISSANNEYGTHIVNMYNYSEYAQVHIAFQVVSTGNGYLPTQRDGDNWFIDDISVQGSCPDVTSFMVNTFGQTTITVGWVGNAQLYDLEIVPSNQAFTGVPTHQTDFSPFQITGLVQGTSYKIRIRSNCGNVFGEWTSEITATTSQPICGTHIYDSGGAGGNYSNSENRTQTICPENAGEYLRLVFNSFVTENNLDILRVYEGNVADPTRLLGTYMGSPTVPFEVQSRLSSGGCITLVFTSDSSVTYAGWDATVNCVNAGPCPMPTDVTLVDVTNTTATYTWVNGYLENRWDVILVPRGVDPTTATPVRVTDTQYTATGLLPNTQYDFYVRAYCTTTDASAYTAIKTFTTTTVAPQPIPYVEDFEGTETAFQFDATTPNKWIVGTAVQNGGTKSMYITNDNGATNTYTITSTTITHATATLSIPQNTPEISVSFDWRAQGQTTLDYLKVWAVPTSYVPVAGTAITLANSNGVQLGGLFNLNGTFRHEDIIVNSRDFMGRNMKLVFEWTNNNTTGTQPPAAVDNINVRAVVCPAPKTIVVTPQTTTALINFLAGNLETQWEVVIQPQGSGVPTQPGVITNDRPYTATGLLPGAAYEVYIRAICSANDSSFWTGPVNFFTNQVPATLPYEENFDGVAIGAITSANQANKWVIGTATSYSPTKALYVSNDNGVTTNYNTGSSTVTHFYRDVQIPANTTEMNLNYYWRSGGESSFDYLRVWIVPQSFTPVAGAQIDATSGGIQLGGNSNLNTAWENRSIDFQIGNLSGRLVRLVFEWRNDSSAGTMPGAGVDNISLTRVTCPKVSNVAVGTVTSNSAVISWTRGNQETSWDIVVLPAGTNDPALATTITNVTTNPYTLTGLLDGVSYEVYVRAHCGTNDTSIWSTQVYVNTPQIPAVLPYFENFDATHVSMGFANGTQVNKWVVGGATFSSPSKSIYVSNNNGVANSYTKTTTSVTSFFRDIAIPATATDLKVQFDWKGVGEANNDLISVWFLPSTAVPQAGTAITAATAGAILVADNLNLQTAYNHFNQNVFVRSLAGTTGKLVFQWKNNASAGVDPAGSVDNIDVSIVECPRPFAVEAINVGPDQLTVRWTAGGTETQWEIILQPRGTGIPAANAQTIIVNGTPTHTFTGLVPRTDYEVYVRALCSQTASSDWQAPLFVRSTQILATLPYDENFDGTDPVFDVTNGTQVNKWVLGTAEFNSATKSVYISNTNGTTNNYVVTSASVVHFYRDFAIPAGTDEMALTFDWKAQGQTTLDYMKVWFVPTSYLPVGGTTIASQNVPGAIALGNIYNLNGTWTTTRNLFPTGANTTGRIVFEWVNDATTGTQKPAAVDNVKLTVVTCKQPTLLRVVQVTESTAQVSWNPGSNETAWELVVQAVGSGEPTQTSVLLPSSISSYTFTGLNPSTTYEYYVRAVCGTNDMSFWSGPVEFRTTQIPAVLPYSENFDNGNVQLDFVNGTQTNKWILGTATFNSPGNSVYISNNGAANAYTVTAASTVHFYRDIAIPANTSQLGVSFDWKAAGQTTLDYLNVWFVSSTNFVPTAGQPMVAGTGIVRLGTILNQKTAWTTEQLVVFNNNAAASVGRLVFEWVNNNTTGTQPPAAVDNINVRVITCPQPTNLVVDQVRDVSAHASWTPAGSETQWEVIVLPLAGANPNANTTGTIVNTPEFNITGLTASTDYKVFVRAICSTTDSSFWTGPATFFTSTTPATLPYYEDFEGAHGFTLNNGSQTNKWFVNQNVVTNSTGKCLFISNSTAGTTHNYTTTTTIVHAYKDILIPTGVREINVSFDWRNNGQASADVLYVYGKNFVTRPVAGTTSLSTSVLNISRGPLQLSNTWSRHNATVDVSAFSGGVMRLYFEWVNDSNTLNQQPAAVDNIAITIPTCLSPINLASQNTFGSNNVHLSWTPVGTETQWEIVVQGQDRGFPDVTTQVIPVNQPFYDFTAVPGTFYEFFVRAVCSTTEKSFWNGPSIFSVYKPEACAEVDVVGVDVEIVNNSIYLCPDSTVENITLTSSFLSAAATSSYAVTQIPYQLTFPLYGGNSMPVTSDDDYTPSFDLPFNFCYFGQSYDNVRIGDNGVVTFGMPYTTMYGEFCPYPGGLTNPIPSANINIKNSILGVYQDLYTTRNPTANTRISYQILGTYPCRTLVVNFVDIPVWSSSCATQPQSNMTSQIVMYEISNIIEIYVTSRIPCTSNWSGSGYIGIVDANGGGYAAPGRNNDAVWTSQNEAYRFTPNGQATFDLSWTRDGVVVGHDQNLTIPTTDSGIYEAKATYYLCDGSTYESSKQVDVRFTRELPTLEPNDITICNTANPVEFDLTRNDAVVLANSNPAEYTITYYTSEALATAHVTGTEIQNPERYEGTDGQTIYMNVLSFAGCSIVKDFNLHIITTVPEFTLSQNNVAVCQGSTTVVNVVPTNFVAADVFYTVTLPDGTVVDQVGPAVTLPINDLAGNYTITVLYGCNGSLPVTVTVLPTTQLNGVFTYPSNVYCSNHINPEVTFAQAQTVPGTFTGTTGLVINPVTGMINLAASTPGNHTVTYTIAADSSPTVCRLETVTTFDLTITNATTAVSAFGYNNDTYCNLDVNPAPIYGQDTVRTGSFSSTAGLVINAQTGLVDLAASTPGVYTVNYHVDGDVAQCIASSDSQFEITIVDKTPAAVAFTYPSDRFCKMNANPTPSLTVVGPVAGVYSSTAGLVIDPTTGTIDLNLSAAGVYTVTYSVATDVNNCIEANADTFEVTIFSIGTPNTDFTFEAAVYCQNLANPTAILDAQAVTGGIFTGSTGLVIDPVTGEINLAGSFPGNHTVTYTVLEDLSICREENSSIFNVTIAVTDLANVEFVYANTIYCIMDVNPTAQLGANAVAGGTFTNTTGLVIDPTTGNIDLAASTIGTHVVSYEVAADPANCILANTGTFTLTITATTAAEVGFSYANTQFCQLEGTVTPTLDVAGQIAGTYSGTPGLVINPQTGAIDLTQSTPGLHTVTYTVEDSAADCITRNSFDFDVTIEAFVTPNVSFTYTDVCYGESNQIPDLDADFTVGGTFSSTTGLVIDPITGEVNVAQSTAGTYTITYTYDENLTLCHEGVSSSQVFTIVGQMKADITGGCEAGKYVIEITPLEDSFDADTVTYSWTGPNGFTSTDKDIVVFSDGDYTVTITTGSCTYSQTFTASSVNCMIPKGISPNGDGKNDSFDLTGMSIKKLTIFNRHGREVYAHGVDYANQWYGQSNDGKTLPDATYYYVIEMRDGGVKTGWVYINKQVN